MTFRSDISVKWTYSPRLVFVAAPSTELTVQDLHDTLRRLEEQPWEGLAFPSIISTTGKQELGGSVTVGLTAQLNNAKVAFEARKDSNRTGAVTTTDTNGLLLNDSGANFITAGIQPGAWIMNKTDGSRASVLRVISATQIESDGLGDGVDNQFASGDTYEIQNVTQCEISGGNLVAVGSDGVTPMPAVLPTMGTQVVRTSSSSATLQELQDVQFSSFNGGVTIDVNSLFSGTVYPTGTPRAPVNNINDAINIATERGFNTFYIMSDLTLTNCDVHEMKFVGHNHNHTLTVVGDADTMDCAFDNLSLIGTLSGPAHIRDCFIFDLDNVDGHISDSCLRGDVTASGSGLLRIINCWDGLAGIDIPAIDCAGIGSEVIIRGYKGGIALVNKTGSEEISIDLVGRVVFDSTVTAGDIIIRGIGKIQLNGATATIDDAELVSPFTIDEQLSSTHGAGGWDAAGSGDWSATEKNQIRGALGILGTQATPAGGGHLQDIRTPVVSNLNSTISSRAVPGDAMTLTSGERDAVADAVWDEAAAGHNTAGTTGQQQNRLDATISSRATQAQILSDATPFQGARIDASISSRSIPGDEMTLTTAQEAELVDKMWDEIAAGHVDAGSTGEKISRLDVAVSTRAEPGDSMDLNPTERAAIADAVWDEPKADHTDPASIAGQLATKKDIIVFRGN